MGAISVRSWEARSVTFQADMVFQAHIMMNGKEVILKKTSFTGSTMGKARTSVHRLAHGNGWRGSKFGT